MSNIKRLYVEKKIGYNIEAINICNDIKQNLNIKGLKSVRILNRYDIEGISDEDYEIAKLTIFSEPPVDIIYEDFIEFSKDETIFAVEFLPGQYDQRADFAMQCIQVISQKEMPIISVAKIFVLNGEITNVDLNRIKNYCINPVDSREAILEKPRSLKIEIEKPNDVEFLDNFINRTRKELIDLKSELGIAMTDEDFIFCQTYFKDIEKRNPTITEIKVIDTYWSDHCRHTTFQTQIEDVSFENGFYKDVFEKAYNNYIDERKYVYAEEIINKNVTLMDIAVIGMKSLLKKGLLNNLDISDEINACSIVVPVDVNGNKEDWLVMFKNETHNHPTEIEPFGGAATCLGGAIRDPLSGRSYVYQAMRVTGAGIPTKSISETIKGKLPQRKIITEAARGYSSYGNQIGIATGQVTEIYDDGFLAKRMEIGAVIGAVKKENIIREKPEKDDVIILVGGRTGRDGCGGATGSSKTHTLDSINTCGAEVQKGNAPNERKLQRLFRNIEVSKIIKRCNDFGAGGISVAIGELADGLIINLDDVQKKYDGLDGTEIAISESQERMAVVVERSNVEKFIEFSNKESLEATPVAVVTDDRRLVMKWKNKEIVNISRDFLDTNGVTQKTNVRVEIPNKCDFFDNTSIDKILIENDIKTAWIENIKKINIASQKGLVERFDSTIGAGTILMPFGGKNQLTPIEAMVSKIPLIFDETETVTIMSYGYDSKISKWSPFHGSVFAIVDSIAKVVATGGNYENIKLTFQEYFEKLGDDYKKWGKPFMSLLGALQVQMNMGIAAIGGKDSMSGTFMDLNVPPTLVSFAVDVTNVNNIISPEFKKSGNKVVYIPIRRDKYDLPNYNYLKEMFKLVSNLIQKGICISACTIKSGGIAEAISKMSFGNYIGVDINNELDAENLFKPEYGSFVLELINAKVIDFMGIDAIMIGETIPEPIIKFMGEEIYIKNIIDSWQQPLEKIFPTQIQNVINDKPEINCFNLVNRSFSNIKLAKPRVFIPIFPGTNCEYDSMREFKKAGASIESIIINNLSINALEESILNIEKTIKNSQIIMFPGGFSAADEPDGSGKYIAGIFRNPRLKEAIYDFLNNRDGLILGICNGFQALIKLGLVPYGEIKEMEEQSPTLTFNSIGRHVSCLVDTKIISNKSPWLWGVNIDDIHTIPVSHGEGRFIAPKSVIQNLIDNGQIATQYVNLNGEPTYDIKYNPNGSMMAIEGITSPDGRIFGKMGHSERVGKNLYKNVCGNKEQKIFESGVNYFK